MTCEEIQDLLPGYVLDALDAHEMEQVDAHLSTCRDHDEELVDLRATGMALALLVALGIVALALMTGLKATQTLTTSAQRQSELLWAQLCADNALNALRLARQMPGIGVRTQACVQAGQTLQVRTEVSATPNPSFVRVDAQVFTAQQPVLRLTSILGRY